MKRRALLAACGAAAASPTAGCLSGFHREPKPRSAILAEIYVVNLRDGPATVEVLVESETETFVDETLALDGRDAAHIDCDWPTEPTPLAVRTRFPGDEWHTVESASFDGDCWGVVVTAKDIQEHLSVHTNAHECDERAGRCPVSTAGA